MSIVRLISKSLVVWGVALTVTAAMAQPAADAPLSGVPLGQGAGVHGANSPYAPLAERSDVLELLQAR